MNQSELGEFLLVQFATKSWLLRLMLGDIWPFIPVKNLISVGFVTMLVGSLAVFINMKEHIISNKKREQLFAKISSNFFAAGGFWTHKTW